MSKIFRTGAILAFSFLIFSATGFAQEMPPTLVEIDKIQTREFHDQITLVGRTEAHIQSRIVAEVAARIESINAGEGVWVNKGGPLISLESDQIGYLLKAKEAETEQVRLQVELVETIVKRNEKLYTQNLISESTIDSIRTWKGITEARYHQLDAERAKLQQDFDHCTIRAPYSGYTGKRLVNIGEWVIPGNAVFEMVELSLVKITVDLPERYFGRLSKGSPVSVTVSERNAGPITGRVTGMAPNASAETHTFPVFIEVTNDSGTLGGGMLVRATLSLDEKYSSLAVSKDAIIRQGPNTMVYTVIEGKAAPISVQTTSSEGKMVAIRGEGLQEGMEVVVRGNERIFPGSPVRVANGGQQQDQTGADAAAIN